MEDNTENGCVKPGKNKVWKFVHHKDFIYKTDRLKGRTCNFDWMSISDDGIITVKGSNGSGYAWDGCTPKGNMFHITFGNFDGKLIKHNEEIYGIKAYYPMTYFASMIHDLMYQYKRCGPYTRKEADLIFLDLAKDSGYMWKWIYFIGIRGLGWVFRGWKYKKENQSGV